jgi:hypothetical protein
VVILKQNKWHFFDHGRTEPLLGVPFLQPELNTRPDTVDLAAERTGDQGFVGPVIDLKSIASAIYKPLR